MRKYIAEILGFAVAGIIIWVLLGGDLPGLWVADASSLPGEARGTTDTTLVEATRSDLPPAAERPAPLMNPSSTVAPTPAATSLPAQIVTLITIILAVVVSAFGAVLLTIWWVGRQRLGKPTPQLVTPESIVVEVAAPPLQQALRPAQPVPGRRASPPARPRATPRGQVVPQLPAPQPAVEEAGSRAVAGAAWTVLTPELALRLQQRLGWTPTDDDLVPNREKRILELQAKLGATTARVAPNHSLAIFPNVLIPLDELQRKAAPQPAVLTVDDQGTPVAVIGLFYTDRLVTPARQPGAETTPSSADLSTARPEPAVPQRSWASIAHPARISNDLPLAIESFLSEIFVIAGRRRTGKSYTLGVVLEELCRYRFPLAVVDLEGEAYGLRARAPILIAGRSSTTEVDVSVSPGQAYALAQWAHRRGQQVILDLSDYARDEQIAFLTAFAEGLWETAKSAEPRRRFALVIDEAHELYPQNQPTGASEILDRLVLRGGKWGITLGFATQRPANLHINARTQAGLAFLHLVEQARDLKAYADMLPKEWTDVRISEAMQGLGRGKVLAKITQAHAPTEVHTVQIRQRITPHMGYSPGMDEQAPPKPGRVALAPALIAEVRQAIERPDQPSTDRHPDQDQPVATSEAAVTAPVPEPYALSEIDRRMLTLAMTDFDGRWPLKQLWPRIKELGWVSWDDLNKRMTPALCAAGYLAKDEQGRWYVTAEGQMVVKSAQADQSAPSLARAA